MRQLRSRVVWMSGLAALGSTFFACVGDAPADGPTGNENEAGGGPVETGLEGGVGADGSAEGGGTCVPGCLADSSTLRQCNAGVAKDTTCDFSCIDGATPHCGVLNPTGLVEPSDFTTAGLGDFDPCSADGGACTVIVHTDTGEIDLGSVGNLLRPMNASATSVEVGAGVGFHLASVDGSTDKLGIFQMKSFTLRGGEMYFVGPNPVAFAAQNDIEIRGTVDVVGLTFGVCVAAAGGAEGGTSDLPAAGLGGGAAGSNSGIYQSGGGGGGSAGAGGAGGQSLPGSTLFGGVGGAPFSGGFDPLRGGGGGGRGATSSTSNAAGGAGAGAIAFFANGTITLGPGSTGTSFGINASGCGSPGGGLAGSNGGAGAGGSVLLQAHTVNGLNGAGIAANGGTAGNGGNGLNGGAAGKRSPISATPAPADPGTSCDGAGGNGGATSAAGAGQAPTGTGCQSQSGGGGGGGFGRIQIGSFTPFDKGDGGFILSPEPTLLAPPVE